MFLVYVDESGDTGTNNSPTRYFILSALIVHESNWLRFLNDLIDFRRELRDHYNFKLREEIHASEFFQSSKKYNHIKKHIKLQICKKTLDFQESLDYIQVMFVAVDKTKHYDKDIFEYAWTLLLQRIHNTLEKNNFDSLIKGNDVPHWSQTFMLIPDKTDDKKLQKLVRKIRRYNPVPSKYNRGEYRDIPLKLITEDPYTKDSAESFIHQLVDVNAYFMKQNLEPKRYMKRKKAHNYIYRLDKILCRHISSQKNGVLLMK